MSTTHIYKEATGCEILLDIHPAQTGSGPSPAILHIHGGALIMGQRAQNPQDMARYTERGYTVFAIDYRLAPESKLPAIISDVQDALTWIRLRGPEFSDIDATRVAAVGHSAGGYLALQSGTFPDPPDAVVSFYGYGDIVGPWYSEPDPFYCTQEIISEPRARANFSGPPVSRPDERPGDGRFYLYCRQQGIWPNEVGGRDPRQHTEFFTPYCPDQNVAGGYPPALLLHGTADTDVPYELSVRMAEALDEQRIEHELITIQGGGHGFEGGHGDNTPNTVIDAWDRVYAFLDRHLSPDS